MTTISTNGGNEYFIFRYLKINSSEDAAACRYPEPEKVQGGRDAYLLGFPYEMGIRSKYAEHNPKI